MVYSINKTNLIEESLTAQDTRKIFQNNGNNMELASAPLSAIPMGSIAAVPMKMVAGYDVGSKVGHPIAGMLLGRDGAMGAASKHTKGMSIRDVYTPRNLINKSAAGLAGAASIIGTNHLIGDGNEAMDIIGAGIGASMPAFAPAVSYGMGKLLGSKRPGQIIK